MPDVTITIGGRSFDVSCQEGEQKFLTSAAKMLDTEADVIVKQIGRLPESRMLLMAGLMLADRTAGMEERVAQAEAKLAALQSELEAVKNAPAPTPERIEVPVIPASVRESMAEIAARAEALAQAVEEKAAG